MSPKKGWIQKVADHLRDAGETVGVLNPLPLPAVHANNQKYRKCPIVHKRGKSGKLYKGRRLKEKTLGVDLNRDGDLNDHQDISLKRFNIMYFKAQEREYSKDINRLERKMLIYKREIRAIEKYLSKRRQDNLTKEIDRVQVIKDRKANRKFYNLKKRAGSLPSDPEMKALKSEIKNLSKRLHSIKPNKRYFMAKIRKVPRPYPGWKDVQERNLYTLKSTHERAIKYTKKHELSRSKEQLKRSQYHLRNARK